MKQQKAAPFIVVAGIAVLALGIYLYGQRQSFLAQPTALVAQPETDVPFPSGEATPRPGATPKASSTPNGAAVGTPSPVSAAGGELVKTQTDLANFDDAHAFQKLIEDVKKSIPTVAHLHTLSEEQVHTTPIEIQNAAVEMGRLAEALEKHPEFSKDAQKFYQDGALNESYPISIRAACYADLQRLFKKQGLGKDSFAQDGSVPANVKKLAAKLM